MGKHAFTVRDPSYPSVVCLMQASAGVTDRTGKNSITNNGISVSTGAAKFGSNSFYFDGLTHYLTMPDTSNYAIGTGDFTIEGWFYPIAYNTYMRLWSKGPLNTATSLDMEFNSADLAKPRMPKASFPSVTGCGFSLNTWHHVAVSRSSGTSRFFVDGVMKYSEANADNATNTGIFYVGIHPAALNASTNFKGYMDQFRVTVGAGSGRYTGNFAVPTAAFPTS